VEGSPPISSPLNQSIADGRDSPIPISTTKTMVVMT
jgi:hypothetical protein